MPLGEDGDEHALEKMILPDDDLLYFIENALHEGEELAAGLVSVVHWVPL
jgi:hypothetical protein